MAFFAGATRLAAGMMPGIMTGIWAGTAAIATAQDPAAFEFQPTKPVPPHGQPWVETAEPDVRTALLWKFVSEADRAAAAEKLLDDGDLDDLVADEDPLPTAGVAGTGAGGQPPKLVGRAAIQDAAGRFGGGAVLEVMIEMEHGFLFMTGVADGSCLAVSASATADVGLVGYELAVAADRIGALLTPALRLELQQGLPKVDPGIR